MAHKLIFASFLRLSQLGNTFWEYFFKKLTARKPETLVYFASTDTHSLYAMLSKSVTYVVLNSSSDTVCNTDYFNKIVQLHNTKLKIPKSYVIEWRNCLIETIRELDESLTDNELAIWINIIDILIEPIGVTGE